MNQGIVLMLDSIYYNALINISQFVFLFPSNPSPSAQLNQPFAGNYNAVQIFNCCRPIPCFQIQIQLPSNNIYSLNDKLSCLSNLVLKNMIKSIKQLIRNICVYQGPTTLITQIYFLAFIEFTVSKGDQMTMHNTALIYVLVSSVETTTNIHNGKSRAVFDMTE